MPNPAELLRSRSYVMLVVFGAIIGVPVAAVAYFFLKLVAEAQQYVFDTLPGELGFDSQPSWWSIPFLALSGLIVAASIRYLPGTVGPQAGRGLQDRRRRCSRSSFPASSSPRSPRSASASCSAPRRR